MASTVVEFDAPDGLTLTLKLYAIGADTLLNTGGDSCTEKTNNKGTYTATVTEALTGLHKVRVTDSNDNTFAKYYVILADDTNTYACFDLLFSSTAELENLATACGNYSATRGLTGTALPAAAADAAGGLPVSDAGGLDLDTALSGTPQTGDVFAALPSNFGSLLINVSGHVSRVTLVDTATANTDMRGTDSAATATELAKVPKRGDTGTVYTQTASDEGTKSATVDIS